MRLCDAIEVLITEIDAYGEASNRVVEAVQKIGEAEDLDKYEDVEVALVEEINDLYPGHDDLVSSEVVSKLLDLAFRIQSKTEGKENA